MNRAERAGREILSLAGIEVDGERDFDIQVRRPELYDRVFADGLVGLGEAYMDGCWDCDALDEMIERLLRADLEHRISPIKLVLPVIASKLINRQRRSRAFEIGEQHYDLGNVLFQKMLDDRMTYSCGYWKEADGLNAAQEAKLDLICRKLGLQSGMRVLDIGCGWGSFAAYAAQKYGVDVVGLTVSREQVELGREMCGDLPVELLLQDYRDASGVYDRIVCVGMFEHVGRKNYRSFMRKVRSLLGEGGLCLLQTIATNSPKTSVEPWTDKYIFPGGMLPTARQITTASEGLLTIEDWHNFGIDYSHTLRAWLSNVTAHEAELAQAGYDERFFRMWRYFLLSSSGAFRARRNHLWQIVYSKGGLDRVYEARR